MVESNLKQTVLVTGSSRVIGLAIAKEFDKHDFHVILHGRHPITSATASKFD